MKWLMQFVTALSTVLFVANSARADHALLQVGTDSDHWTITAGGATDAPSYGVYIVAANRRGVSVTTTGNGAGTFLVGGSLTNFDGYWTANNSFYLPANATNISLTYSNLEFDDAGVVFLNGIPFTSTTTSAASSTNDVPGQFVFTDGAPSQPWIFSGQDYYVSGVVTNGFILGGQNTLTAIVNNTGSAASGNLSQGLAPWDGTSFTLYATLNYDVIPGDHSISLGMYPGIQINGLAGATYQIQYTTNVSTGPWLTLTNITLPETPYMYFDTDSANRHSARFYRILSQ